MNVACTACPAKYAVPDERVRGKRARITCKHCGTSIIVDGTHLGPSEGGSVVAARPARKTMVGMGAAGTSASAPPAASMPTHSAPVHSAPTHSAPSNAPPSGGTAWLVALADGRREPASLARIVDLYAAGTIDAATYLWREGMPDWKTPFTVPEIAAALTARGLAPQRPSAGALAPQEPDPEEATRVGMAAYEDPRARRPTLPPLRSGSGLHKPPAEDDDGITIARSGPPSSPVSLPPLRPRSDPPPAAGWPAAAQALRRNTPAATRPPSNPPPPAVPAAVAAPGRRPRAHTLPGDLVIPLTGPGAPPPTPMFAPRNQPFAAAAAAAAMRTPSSPPPPGAPPPAPSNVQASSAPPPPPPPNPLPPPSALASAQQILAQSPAFALPQVAPTPSSVNLPAPAQSAMHLPAAVRSAADFEVPPRSAAPVSLPLELAPQRMRRNVATAATIGLLALAGVGAALYFKSSARPTKAAIAPVVSAPAVVAAPPPASVAPAPSSEPETAPAPSAEPEKPAAKERSASAATRAAAKRDDAPRAASTKKTDLVKAVSGEASSATEETPSEGESEARVEETAKKADTAGAGTAPFDRDAAANALSDAALRAGTCRMLGGPTGSAQATVTFAPNGHVSGASVGGDFAGSVVGACIVKLFRGATVPPFAGDPVTVAKRFTIE
ncbi:MAG TPA: DUF4339 domain-containing protein [Polyangiaceae bacterium]|nr:DUF4339 domain-containing protein [Polyangiaceae bacterium]